MKKRKKTSTEKHSKLFTVLGLLVFGTFAVCLIALMYWTVISTLKSTGDFRNNNLFGLPKEWAFGNYATAIEYFRVQIKSGLGLRWVTIGEMIYNTILYAGVGTLVCIICHYIVAYCCAKFDYRFSRIVYAVVLLVMIIPIVGSDASRLALLREWGMYDNWWGFFFQRYHFQGMYFLIIYETIRTVPKELSEAAQIDGASEFRIMNGIVLPMVIGMLGAATLITFIGQWNEFQFAVMYMPTHPTLSYGLYMYNKSALTEVARSVPLQLSGCMLLFLPILTLFCCFKDKIMGSLTLGGVKE